MKLLILCDRESDGGAGADLRGQTERAAALAGWEVQSVVLNGDEIRPCVGCFGCWVKTPGLCVVTDDCANGVSRALMRSDAAVLLSRLTYGGYSRDVKAFLDRAIPNILPFFEVYRGEIHHKRRYGKFPYLISIGYGESTDEERRIFRELTLRNALNLRPPKHYCFTARDEGERAAVAPELTRILTEEVRA